jgi:hypothetical protein
MTRPRFSLSANVKSQDQAPFTRLSSDFCLFPPLSPLTLKTLDTRPFRPFPHQQSDVYSLKSVVLTPHSAFDIPPAPSVFLLVSEE